MTPLRIGTRSSRLALWQAEHVAALLRPEQPVDLVHIQTQGDRDRAASLTQIGGQGVFTKEIQHALLEHRVDIAVHSLKDLPTLPTPGLTLAAVPPRGPTADVLVSKAGMLLGQLPAGARIATGSVRRRALLLNRRPDLTMVDIRGNVDTRLQMVDSGRVDALVLAEAGLQRLGLESEISERLDPAWMIHAVGQGALGIECRVNDTATIAVLSRLDDAASRAAVTAERALLFHLGGGCQAPVGADARIVGGRLILRAVVLSPDGQRRIDGELGGPCEDAEMLGSQLAKSLSAQGADAILRSM